MIQEERDTFIEGWKSGLDWVARYLIRKAARIEGHAQATDNDRAIASSLRSLAAEVMATFKK